MNDKCIQRLVLKTDVLDQIRRAVKARDFFTTDGQVSRDLGMADSTMELDILGFDIKKSIWITREPILQFRFYTFIDSVEFDKGYYVPSEGEAKEPSSVVSGLLFNIVQGLAVLIAKGMSNHIGMLRHFEKIDIDEHSFEYQDRVLEAGEFALRSLTPAHFVIVKKWGPILEQITPDMFQSLFTPVEEYVIADDRPGFEIVTFDEMLKKHGNNKDAALDDFLSILSGKRK